MGACGSREGGSSSRTASGHRYQAVSPLPPVAVERPATPVTMGQPSTPAQSASFHNLSSQHERLMLELLPFKDAAQFHEWLQSVYVRGSWLEFSRDFLARAPVVPEPDKTKTSQAAKDALNSRTPKFLIHHPDKRDWSDQDHHVRFIVTVVSDNMLKGLWSESDWKKRGSDIAKAVYEVLSFLRASHMKGDHNLPRYEA